MAFPRPLFGSARCLLFQACILLGGCHPAPRPLRVCVDPNNLPFSSRTTPGFEQHIALLLGRDLKRPVRFVWWAQRRGHLRQTLGANLCDIWPGVTGEGPKMATTQPYYVAPFVFVSRKADALDGLTLNDPRLRKLRIGIPLIGDDGANIPPAELLLRKGFSGNLRGYSLYGDYRRADPPAALIEAVSKGEVDIALAWGPMAGYHAARAHPPLHVTPIRSAQEEGLPMRFAISVGVRQSDAKLRAAINTALVRHQGDIDHILKAYRVPHIVSPSVAQ